MRMCGVGAVGAAGRDPLSQLCHLWWRTWGALTGGCALPIRQLSSHWGWLSLLSGVPVLTSLSKAPPWFPPLPHTFLTATSSKPMGRAGWGGGTQQLLGGGPCFVCMQNTAVAP